MKIFCNSLRLYQDNKLTIYFISFLISLIFDNKWNFSPFLLQSALHVVFGLCIFVAWKLSLNFKKQKTKEWNFYRFSWTAFLVFCFEFTPSVFASLYFYLNYLCQWNEWLEVCNIYRVEKIRVKMMEIYL